MLRGRTYCVRRKKKTAQYFQQAPTQTMNHPKKQEGRLGNRPFLLPNFPTISFSLQRTLLLQRIDSLIYSLPRDPFCRSCSRNRKQLTMVSGFMDPRLRTYSLHSTSVGLPKKYEEDKNILRKGVILLQTLYFKFGKRGEIPTD